MTSANDLALRRALEAAGVEFIDENGGSPGACLQWVGIAGEDDLDAPDIADEPPQRDKSAEVGVAPGSNLEPAPARSSSSERTNPAAPPFGKSSAPRNPPALLRI